MADDYTLILSGPKTTRAPLLAGLERAGFDLSEGQDPDGRAASRGLPTSPEVGWVKVRAPHPDSVAEHAKRAGWALSLHHPTPKCRACRGEGKANSGTAGLGACLNCGGKGFTNRKPPSAEEQLRATVQDLQARLARLEANR